LDNSLEQGSFLDGGSDLISSRLRTKGRTRIPQPIRNALRLKEGDELVYQIEGESVILSKAPRRRKQDDPFHTFGQWHSAADRKAYSNL
jgi:antitoxin PrlF